MKLVPATPPPLAKASPLITRRAAARMVHDAVGDWQLSGGDGIAVEELGPLSLHLRLLPSRANAPFAVTYTLTNGHYPGTLRIQFGLVMRSNQSPVVPIFELVPLPFEGGEVSYTPPSGDLSFVVELVIERSTIGPPEEGVTFTPTPEMMGASIRIRGASEPAPDPDPELSVLHLATVTLTTDGSGTTTASVAQGQLGHVVLSGARAVH